MHWFCIRWVCIGMLCSRDHNTTSGRRSATSSATVCCNQWNGCILSAHFCNTTPSSPWTSLAANWKDRLRNRTCVLSTGLSALALLGLHLVSVGLDKDILHWAQDRTGSSPHRRVFACRSHNHDTRGGNTTPSCDSTTRIPNWCSRHHNHKAVM